MVAQTEDEICTCGAVAVWYYAPSVSGPEPHRAYCEEHVPRGCSCTADDGPDELGRPAPCCEYLWIGPTDLTEVR